MKQFITLLSAAVMFSFFAQPSFAASCQPVFGGGQTCQNPTTLSLDKTIQVPGSQVFVQNLTASASQFAPSQKVVFHLTIKNTGNNDITSITIKDMFPKELAFSSGTGNFDTNSHTLSLTVPNLKKNTSKTFTIVGTTAAASTLPLGQTCVQNTAQAVTTDGQTTSDSTSFCISNQGTPSQKIAAQTKGGLAVLTGKPIQATPPTGPETLPLLALVPSGIIGLLLRKKS